MRISHRPIPAQGLFREGRNVFFRLSHRHAQRFVCFERGSYQLGLGYDELVSAQPGPVEPFRQFQQSLITALLDLLENGPRALINARVEKTGRRSHLAQSLREICVTVPGHIHARRG